MPSIMILLSAMWVQLLTAHLKKMISPSTLVVPSNRLTSKEHLLVLTEQNTRKWKPKATNHENLTNAWWLILLAHTVHPQTFPEPQISLLNNHKHTHTQKHVGAGCIAPTSTLCLELDCQSHTQTQTMLSIGVFWGDSCRKHDNGICHPDVAAVSASISIMKESFTNCKCEWISAVS